MTIADAKNGCMQSRPLPPGYEEALAYAQGKKDGIAEAQIIDRARDRELEQQKASAQRSWAEVEQLRKQVASLEAESGHADAQIAALHQEIDQHKATLRWRAESVAPLRLQQAMPDGTFKPINGPFDWFDGLPDGAVIHVEAAEIHITLPR